MKIIENFRREELVDSLCHHAKQLLIESFPEQQRLWEACNYQPRVDYEFKAELGHLVVRYSMIFRSESGAVYKITKRNIMLDKILGTILYKEMQAIVDDWTCAFQLQVATMSKIGACDSFFCDGVSEPSIHSLIVPTS